MRIKKFIFLLTLGCLVASPAYAYLDGGTGSIIVQGLFAGIAGFLAVIKLYWRNFKNFIHRLRGKRVTETPLADEQTNADTKEQ